MAECKHCGSHRIAHLGAHHRDCFNLEVSHLDVDHDGYAPKIPAICRGDDTNISFCLDCGMIQNYIPISDEELLEVLERA